MNQNYGKAEMNNKVMQSPALGRKKKALHHLVTSKLEITNLISAEFLDDKLYCSSQALRLHTW